MEGDRNASAKHQSRITSRPLSPRHESYLASARLSGCIGEPFCIYRRLHGGVFLQLVVYPKLHWKLINIPVQSPASREGNRLLRKARDRTTLVCCNGNAIEGDAEVVSHDLQTIVLRSVEPGQPGVTRKEICPSLERSRHLYAEFLCLFEDRRTWIWREDIRPELCAGKTAAHVHHEVNGFATLFLFFSREGEDDVE